MPRRPRFSVITACFNDLPNLIKTAESVTNQSSDDWEWIVVDGASTDGTPDYLRSHKLTNFRWVSQPDDGIYDAFNKGARLSQGEYLIYICAGDRFSEPGTLEQVSEFIAAQPGKDVYYADSFEVDGNGNRYLRSARGHDKIWWNLFTHHQAIFYARTCFDNASYDESFRISGDYDFTAVLLDRGAAAARMPFATADFLLGGTSQQNYWKSEAENWETRKRLGVPLVKRAAIYAAHAVIRIGRTRTPALYRFFRYTSSGGAPAALAPDGNE